MQSFDTGKGAHPKDPFLTRNRGPSTWPLVPYRFRARTEHRRARVQLHDALVEVRNAV